MKKTLTKINSMSLIGNLMLSLSLLLMTTPVWCDKFGSAAQNAANGIQNSAQGAVKFIIIIVLVVIGFTLIIGSQRQREGVKEKAPVLIAGVALIVCAGGFASIIFGWF